MLLLLATGVACRELDPGEARLAVGTDPDVPCEAACDSAAPPDADGDGHLALDDGGDDCDDGDASAYPGAAEVQANATDDDCDGRVDELVACWDGTGDYETIQEAIDAAPVDGAVEVCPGEWAEGLSIDKGLTLVGTGEMPEDVRLIGTRDVLDLLAVGASDGAVVVIDWLVLSAPYVGHRLLHATGASDVQVRRVWGTGYAENQLGVGFYSAHTEGSMGIELSQLHGVYVAGQGRRLAVTASELSGVVVYGNADTEVEVSNNIVLGGVEGTWTGVGGWWCPESAAAVRFENNTVVETNFVLGIGLYDCGVLNLSAQSNILSAVEARGDTANQEGEAAILGYQLDGNSQCFPPWSLPRDSVAVRGNVVFATDAWRAYVDCPCPGANFHCDRGEAESELETIVATGATYDDPLFEANDEMGSFALAAASPARDGGVGDADPDGSPNDAGAFGGPGGNWYLDYPWTLD